MNFLPFPFACRSCALLAAGLAVVFQPTRVRADVVFAWNEALLQFSTHVRGVFPPHLEARAYAMTHIAIHDAIESTTRQVGAGDQQLAAQRAAAASAAEAVLESVLPQNAAGFHALATHQLAAIPDSPAKAKGMALGRAAAEAILQRREKDGWALLAALNPPAGPLPDTTAKPPAALVRGEDLPPSPWLQAKPFILKTAKQFEAREPRTLQHDGRMLVDNAVVHSRLFEAVDAAVAVETNEVFWSQRPLVVWNRIARQLAAARTLELRDQAKLLAALNIAAADATVAALHWRYAIGTWRSITLDLFFSIEGAEPLSTDVLVQVDDGLRSEFARRDIQRALIPPTPNYPSLAATVAGAAQAALAGFLKSDEIGFTLPTEDPAAPSTGAKPAEPRLFTRISTAGKECAFVASLDGHHCREACVSGYSLGAAVGGYVGKRLASAGR